MTDAKPIECNVCGTPWRWSRDAAGKAIKLEVSSGLEHIDRRCRDLGKRPQSRPGFR